MASREVTTTFNLKAGDQSGVKGMRDAAAAADKAAAGAAKLDQQLKRTDATKVDQSARAYKDVAAQADKAAASAAKANAAVAGGGGPRQPQVIGGVQAGGPPVQRPAAPGAPGGGIFNNPQNQELLAVAGGVFAATQTMVKGLEMAAKAATAFADDSLSASQKQRKIVEALDPTGISTNLGLLADALAGKTEAIRKAGAELPKVQAKAGAELAAFQTSFPLEQQQAALEARQRARGAIAPLPFNPPAGGTLQGEQDLAAFERRRPALQQQREAQIDAAAAVDVAAGLEKQRSDLAKQLAEAEQRRKQAQEKQKQAEQQIAASGATLSPVAQFGFQVGQAIQGGGASGNNLLGIQLGNTFAAGSGADKQRIDAAAAIKKELAEEQKIRSQLITVTQQQGEAAKGAAEAESRARKAGLELMKTEVELLKEREQRVVGQAQQFGGLDASERITAAQAARQFRERGFESLTKDQIQFLNAAGGGAAIAAAQQQSALNDPLFKQIAADLGLESDLKKIREERFALQADIDAKFEFDSQKLTDDIAKAMKPVVEQIKEALKGAITDAVIQIQTDQEIANASR